MTSDLVAYLPTEIVQRDAKILKLQHPKEPSKHFLVYFVPDTGACYELLTVKDKHSSWFVDNAVVSSNQLIIATPLDPLFLVLPYLHSNTLHYRPLDQVLVDEQYPDITLLDGIITSVHLDHIADIKSADDCIIKYSQDKTLVWLRRKVNAVIKEMKAAGVSPGFNSELKDRDYQMYACGMVSDYIPGSLKRELLADFGIEEVEIEQVKDEVKSSKRQTQNEDNEQPPKRQKVTGNKVKQQKQTRAQKQLAGVNTKGMKSMMAFFSKK